VNVKRYFISSISKVTATPGGVGKKGIAAFGGIKIPKGTQRAAQYSV
jgi:hypothetical protein